MISEVLKKSRHSQEPEMHDASTIGPDRHSAGQASSRMRGLINAVRKGFHRALIIDLEQIICLTKSCIPRSREISVVEVQIIVLNPRGLTINHSGCSLVVTFWGPGHREK